MTKSDLSVLTQIETLSADQAEAELAALGEVLWACVQGGAGIGFVLPFEKQEAVAFWRSRLAGLGAGERHLLVARVDGRIVGTVMLELAPQDNGRHRAEVAKLMVHPEARRQGLAGKLLAAVEDLALSLARTLLVLDTVTGDTAESVYPKAGYSRVGVIPGYAQAARGGLDATTVFYKQLG
ncbi:GNAT family N-acetyltransferase [uncultured Roseibium sp.]|uniref:GNAT family N-acetyltransferase n=1 Tax=uncultured Roseibium sp. TaxID=1936171 RepID=UPI003217A831